MRIRATCHACQRDLLLFQLYNTPPGDADKCPHCQRNLGVPNIRVLARAADEASARLINVLHQLGERHPGLGINAESLLAPIEEALEHLPTTPTSPVIYLTEPSILQRLRRRLAS